MLGVARTDEHERPQLLRLSEGLAVHTGERVRYLCPALFDSDETPRVAAAPGGPVFVAAGRELFVLDGDGDVAHYDHDAAAINGLEANDDAVFALFADADGNESELARLDEDGPHVLARVPRDFTSLAAEGDTLLVAGLTGGGRLRQRGFDLAGAELPALNAEAKAPLDAVAVFARLAGGQPYLLVVAGNALGTELARLERDGEYDVVQRAGGVISGPIALDADRALFAFDGRLAELTAGMVMVRDTEPIVTCVGERDALRYACTASALVRIERDGALGEPVFALDQVEPPDVSAFDAELAERCTLQWLRFRADLIRAGVEPDDGDATGSGGTADGGSPDAGRDEDAGPNRGPRRDAGDGCSARPGRSSSAFGGAALWLLAALIARGTLRSAGRARSSTSAERTR